MPRIMSMLSPTAEAETDETLLQQATAGNTAAFDALFHRHYDRVYGLLFRLVGNRDEAEELLQEVFLRLYQRPPQRASEPHNLGAWLYRVAMNTGYNAIRTRKRQWQRNRVLVPPASDPAPQPEQQVVLDETTAQVRHALSQLQPAQAQLLLLRQMGLSYAELAEACDIKASSVGTMLSRAARAFKRIYTAVSPQEPT